VGFQQPGSARVDGRSQQVLPPTHALDGHRCAPAREGGNTARFRTLSAARNLAPLENTVALPEADATVDGIKVLRPQISQAVLAAVSARYTPQGEIIALEMETGVTAMASISPIRDRDCPAAPRRLLA